MRDEADAAVAALDAMVDDPRYEFAWGMLVDMRATILRLGRVSEGQAQAIKNVVEGTERHQEQRSGWERHEQRTGRRYEGWSGRHR